jgi:large subunit ribosomal protein L16
MGKGKGAVEYYVAVVKPGRILFEISGLDAEDSQEVLEQAAHKLPIKTQVVGRLDAFSSTGPAEHVGDGDRS